MDGIAALFEAYAEAFSRGDSDAVTASWAFPAFFAARGKRAALDETAFRANCDALIRFYRAQGGVRAEKTVVSAEPLFEGLWLVRTGDRVRDRDGAAIAAWEHLYLVSRTETGLRVVAAFADAELDAWAARGTPLGSW